MDRDTKLIAILRRQYHIILTASWEKIYNISRDILDSVFYYFSCTVYYVITFLNSIIQKR